MGDGEFTGFTPGTTEFYRELAVNNNREWFEEHKKAYQAQVLDPAQRFTAAVGRRLQELSKDVVYDTRTSGSGSISRIYRDVRFAKDKTPYKTWLGIVFWQEGKRMATPAYYFGLDAAGASMHTGWWHGWDKTVLEKYRRAAARTSSAVGSALGSLRVLMLRHMATRYSLRAAKRRGDPGAPAAPCCSIPGLSVTADFPVGRPTDPGRTSSPQRSVERL